MKNKKKIIVALVIIALGVFSYTTYAENIKLQDQIKDTDARAVNYAENSCHDAEPGYEMGKNGCLMEHAIASGAPAVCGMITSNVRFDCYRQVAGIINDVSVCESIVAFDGAYQETYEGLNGSNMSASMEKDACYHDIAYKNKSPHVCKNIVDDQDFKNFCQKCALGESEDTGMCPPLNLLPEHL